MKTLKTKVLPFVLAVLLINLMLNLIFSNRITEDRFTTRYNYLKKNLTSYNTLFFGSSRTLRHTIPATFDSVNQVNGVETNSFNLGTPGNTSFETYMQYESFLDFYKNSEDKSIKTVFLEIFPLTRVSWENSTSSKSVYWMSLKNAKRLYGYVNDKEDYTLKRKASYSIFSIPLFLKYFGFGYINFSSDSADKKIWLGKNSDGFLSYEEEIALSKSEHNKKSLLEQRNDFVKDTTQLESRKQAILEEMKNEDNTSNFNPSHAEVLKELMAKSEELGINLIFTVHPRLNPINEMQALKEALPNRIIDMSNPNDYKEFWMVETSFNHAHLNTAAAKIYTKELAKIFESNRAEQFTKTD
ncbi:hypothetical protein [Chondrinema litorale]|uniref:hypothetical protein n=1 Tax=Chondrinema litorale TaxID=2994555 RepID=UPI002542E6D1|nr:hypothetical protein [Chondrinema litorale]UZR96697.1 hypothetical protein OQ292_21360 [Chondrinema litorale]